jgi:nicotinate-nucleotide adenylyltransferase
MMPRTALFGGTFDPIHDAHLAVARAAADRFDLARVLFVPAANPPHKSDQAQAPYEDRIRMAQLACESEPRFEVSRIEQGTERSYSILTIERLQAAGTGPLCFLIGADAFSEIQTWRSWQDVVRQVEFIVVSRPNAIYSAPEGASVHELTGMYLPVSSSEIRARLAEGDEDVPVPRAVLAYIRERGIYRSQEPQKLQTHT